MPAAMSGSMAYEVEKTLRTIFKRCIECPENQNLVCPACAHGYECVLVPPDCNACAHMNCIINPVTYRASQRPSTAALAGGVIGGVAFVAVVVWLVWRFWIKKKREQQDLELEEEWKNDGGGDGKRRTRFGASDGASTRTRGSLANSILSRASNIIHIAYIPGVMNRGGSNTDSHYDTPVPPIPAAFRSGQQTPKTPLSNTGDALYFAPSDLRDSTWSDDSSIRTSRYRDTQYTTNSISPSLARESVASDAIYFDDAMAAPMPANAAQRATARMVSIKPTSTTPPEGTRSPRHGLQVVMPGQGPAQGPQRVKATQVAVGRNKSKALATGPAGYLHVPTVPSPLSGANTPESEDGDEHVAAQRSLLAESDRSGASTPLSQPVTSPFYDASERPTASFATAVANRPNPYASMASSIRRSTDSPMRPKRSSFSELSVVAEEASRRASTATSGVDNGLSPFGDEHATE